MIAYGACCANGRRRREAGHERRLRCIDDDRHRGRGASLVACSRAEPPGRLRSAAAGGQRLRGGWGAGGTPPPPAPRAGGGVNRTMASARLGRCTDGTADLGTAAGTIRLLETPEIDDVSRP